MQINSCHIQYIVPNIIRETQLRKRLGTKGSLHGEDSQKSTECYSEHLKGVKYSYGVRMQDKMGTTLSMHGKQEI